VGRYSGKEREGCHTFIWRQLFQRHIDGHADARDQRDQCHRIIRMLEKPVQQRTPIIAVTAHALKGDKEACLSAGMDVCLPKPVDIDEFYAVVERWTNIR
jgi:CheY-like chemotaxis protein